MKRMDPFPTHIDFCLCLLEDTDLTYLNDVSRVYDVLRCTARVARMHANANQVPKKVGFRTSMLGDVDTPRPGNQGLAIPSQHACRDHSRFRVNILITPGLPPPQGVSHEIGPRRFRPRPCTLTDPDAAPLSASTASHTHTRLSSSPWEHVQLAYDPGSWDACR